MASIHPGQLVVLQVAALAAVLAGRWWPWPGALMVAAAVLVGAVTLGRRHGRWLFRWPGDYLRYRIRARRWRAALPGPPVQQILPNLHIRTHTDRAGYRIGLARDGHAWSAVLRMSPPERHAVEPACGELLRMLVAARDDEEIPLESAHIVAYSVPTQPGLERAWWIAVRLAPGMCQRAIAARGGGELGAARATSIVAVRLMMGLHAAGLTAALLDGDELRAQLNTLLGAPHAADHRGRSLETWRWWAYGPFRHFCYLLRRPPRDAAGLAAMLSRVAAAPAVFTCASVLFGRDRVGRGRTSALLRLGVPGPSARPARRLRRGVTRLDGEHGPAVLATVPLGRGRDAPVMSGRGTSSATEGADGGVDAEHGGGDRHHAEQQEKLDHVEQPTPVW